MKANTVLITGGSGFLGINLCRYLYNKGYKIKVIDLAPFDYPDFKDKIDFYNEDIRNVQALKTATKGADFVVHTAAALPLYKKEDIFSTDIIGTKNVLEAAKKLKVKRVVHVSSTAVYGIPDHHPLLENDNLDGVGPYGKAKILAEQACEQYRKQGMCISILRPKSFVGPERLGVLAIYYQWVKNKKNIPFIGSGKNRYQLLDVEDLCEAIYICLTKNKSKVNDTFNIGAKEFTTMGEDFQEVINYAGTKKKIIPIPAQPLIISLRILEFLRLSPLYKWVYESASPDSFVSIANAEKILGFTPKYSNKNALVRNYKWYIENYDSFKKQTGISHWVPWNQGILKLISWFF